MVLMLFPPQKFVYPPYCYYRLQEIKMYTVGVIMNGTPFTNFVKISELV